MKWIKNHWFGLTIFFILSILPLCIIGEVVHYNLEPEHKVYIEWTVYDGSTPRHYKGTYDMVGERFEIHNYWQSAGKYNGSYRVVRIVDKDNWSGYIGKQSVCIYTGMNDVEVNKIEIIE